MHRTASQLNLQEFLALPQSSERYELFCGQLQPKMSPKYKHSTLQLRLLLALNSWCDQFGCGRVRPEWGVILRRQEVVASLPYNGSEHGDDLEDWVPVPDLLYVSYERLPEEWDDDEPCPILPELVIEIISPGQTFGELTFESYRLSAGWGRASMGCRYFIQVNHNFPTW